MIKADNHCITFQKGQISIFEDCPIILLTGVLHVCKHLTIQDLGFTEYYFYRGLEKNRGAMQDKDGVKGSPIDVKDPFLKYQV